MTFSKWQGRSLTVHIGQGKGRPTVIKINTRLIIQIHLLSNDFFYKSTIYCLGLFRLKRSRNINYPGETVRFIIRNIKTLFSVS